VREWDGGVGGGAAGGYPGKKGMGRRPEVEGAPDMWVPHVREGKRGEIGAGACGPAWAESGAGPRGWVGLFVVFFFFFLFFSNPFSNLLNSNLFHVFKLKF
jgi:hypothetical protein